MNTENALYYKSKSKSKCKLHPCCRSGDKQGVCTQPGDEGPEPRSIFKRGLP